MKKDLILLPGLTNTKDIWNDVLEQLPSTIQGHAFDIPSQLTLEGIVDELLSDLPKKFYLCGFSFGGYVALEILNKVPERVLGLIMIGSTVREDSDRQKTGRIKTIERVKNKDYFKMIEGNIQWLFHPESVKNKELIDLHRKISKEYTESQYISHLKATMNRQDYTNLIKNSSIKKLFIAGDSDQIMPSEILKKQSDNIPNTTFEIISNTGHMIPLEQPNSIASIISNWINSN